MVLLHSSPSCGILMKSCLYKSFHKYVQAPPYISKQEWIYRAVISPSGICFFCGVKFNSGGTKEHRRQTLTVSICTDLVGYY
ncbi:Uncharacterized protein TCM_030618 [Theobroma cacao]|uniref:Uncharacterized protein n=1 Tax=Theobroma cacao TaxID=3641 RepID=A0A061FBX8_THECC|nr:Uncharacterized protein TCM_030618 [Theobroma cacao]